MDKKLEAHIEMVKSKAEESYKRSKIKLLIIFALANLCIWYVVSIGRYHWYAGILVSLLTSYLTYRLLPIMKSGILQRKLQEYKDQAPKPLED